MKKTTTYKAARLFGKAPTQRPEPLWFVAPKRPFFKGEPTFDWRTGLEQEQCYYMDKGLQVPIAKTVWRYDFEKRQVTQTWHWAIDYKDAWEADTPISDRYSTIAYQALRQRGRQQILDYLMLQGRQAFGAEADANISLLYGHYHRELATWQQSGIATPFYQALDTDVAEEGTTSSLAQVKSFNHLAVGNRPIREITFSDPDIGGGGYVPPSQPSQEEQEREERARQEAERQRRAAAAQRQRKAAEEEARKQREAKARAIQALQDAVTQQQQREVAAVKAILAKPLGCESIPEALKGKKVIDCLKYYIY